MPGFVDDKQHRIVPSWQQQFTDEFGTKQDYVSTKKGLDEGIAEGVFEIESHGWTHMQPDLTSPPGPWWGSPIDQERAEMGWYREFYDIRREKEIPAAEQTFHMQQSAEWLKAEFGFFPLEFSTGGNGISRSPDNNTWQASRRGGFRLLRWISRKGPGGRRPSGLQCGLRRHRRCAVAVAGASRWP